MNHPMVPKKPTKLPKGLEKLFDNPPLVGNEKREDYDAFCSLIEKDLEPADFILWLQIREYADISWELQRERRIKAEIIKLKQKEARPTALGPAKTRAAFERAKLSKAEGSESIFKKKELEPEAKVKPGEEDTAWLPEAYMLGHHEIDIIDTRIASYLFRRHTVLREIERYSDSLARKLDKAAPPIIDGEFSDAAE
jgi:hypothetical protein